MENETFFEVSIHSFTKTFNYVTLDIDIPGDSSYRWSIWFFWYCCKRSLYSQNNFLHIHRYVPYFADRRAESKRSAIAKRCSKLITTLPSQLFVTGKVEGLLWQASLKHDQLSSIPV
jgi:hypothetical protein